MRDIAGGTMSVDGPRRIPTVPSMADYPRDPKTLHCTRGGREVISDTHANTNDLVTVVTVAFNCVNTLSRTLESIRSQTYKKIQYIIVDGGSQDGTLELIKKHEAAIDIWLSEPDQGISDAFNKGIALAAGEYVALVNADDWLDPNHLQLSIEHLERSDADFTFGNLVFHDTDGTALYTVTGDPEYRRSIQCGMPDINHPSMVCRRALYDRVGLFDKSFRIAMDYEWLLRSHMTGARGAYLPKITSHMEANGISQRRILQSLKEVEQASIRYGYPPGHARVRYWIRAAKLTSRLLIEKRISPSLAKSLRALINRRYRNH